MPTSTGSGARTNSGHEKRGSSHGERFDFEKLDVYRVALEFLGMTEGLLTHARHKSVRDQLERASESIVANIAEGAGKTARQDKRHAFEIARGSAMECGALLDVLRIRSRLSPDAYREAKTALIRITQMLSRMCSGPR